MDESRKQTTRGSVSKDGKGYRVKTENSRSSMVFNTKHEAVRAAKGFSAKETPMSVPTNNIVIHLRHSTRERRSRRSAAIAATLGVFLSAVIVGAQFLKPLVTGEPRPVESLDFFVSLLVPIMTVTGGTLVLMLSRLWKRNDDHDPADVWAASLAGEVWDDAKRIDEIRDSIRGVRSDGQ